MSKRNTKLQLDLPIYDLKSQLDYITQICKDYEFDGDRLISYILADFIFVVQKGLCSHKNMDTIFVKYLQHTSQQRKLFDKLKELSENGKS